MEGTRIGADWSIEDADELVAKIRHVDWNGMELKRLEEWHDIDVGPWCRILIGRDNCSPDIFFLPFVKVKLDKIHSFSESLCLNIIRAIRICSHNLHFIWLYFNVKSRITLHFGTCCNCIFFYNFMFRIFYNSISILEFVLIKKKCSMAYILFYTILFIYTIYTILFYNILLKNFLVLILMTIDKFN